MSTPITLLILIAALITACISGIFGMAGGLIFMGVIASVMSVSEAMVVHGYVQSLSNSTRAFLIRKNIRWDLYLKMGIGAVPALLLLSLAQYVPSKGVLFLGLGLLPLLLWVPSKWIQFDAQKPGQAALCGFFVTSLNLVAGVAGPALDLFFVKTEMPRHQIVATKAVAMFTSHMMKIVYFGVPLLMSQAVKSLPPFWFFIAVIPCVMAGTYLGTRLLNRLSDIGFKRYTRWIVTGVGAVYLVRGLSMLGVL